MRRICVLTPLLLLAISAHLSAQNPPQSEDKTEFVQIDGAKTPEQIPEYLTWSSGFEVIGYLTEKKITHGPMTFLQQLSPSDRDVLFAEVSRHKERLEKCQARGAQLVETINDLEKLEQEMKANTLECRIKLLDAKDLMLTRMSPEGVAVLTNWMLEERRKIKSLILKSDLEFYRLPR